MFFILQYLHLLKSIISASAVENHPVEKICVSIIDKCIRLLLNAIIQKLMVDLHKKDNILQEFKMPGGLREVSLRPPPCT